MKVQTRQFNTLLAPWLSTLTLVIVVVFINKFLILVEKPSFIRTVSIRLKAIFQWNYCISTFVTYYGNLVFYSSLQFLTASYCVTGLDFTSLVFCVLANIALLMFLGKVVTMVSCIIRSQSNLNVTSHLSQTPNHHHYIGCEIIFRDFKHRSYLQIDYFVAFILRLYVFNTVIVYLFSSPTAQTAIFSVFCVLMLLYLVIVQPMKRKIDLAYTIAQEFLLLIVNISIMILSLVDKGSIHDVNNKMRNTVEDIVVWCNVAFFILITLYNIAMIGKQSRETFVKLKTWYQKRQSAKVRNESQAKLNISGSILSLSPFKRDLNFGAADQSQADVDLINSFVIQDREHGRHANVDRHNRIVIEVNNDTFTFNNSF